MKGRALPPIHAVTSDEILARAGFVEAAVAVLEAGGAAVALHLRGPRTSGARLFALAATLAPVARTTGGELVVNDRVDVARAAGAGGVQLPERGMPLPLARGLLGEEGWIGRSVHDLASAGAARAEGADYLVAGPLYSTESHPDVEGRGIGWLREIVAGGTPVVAIGGITPERVMPALEGGARGVAAIRAVWDADDPGLATRRFREASEGRR